MVNKWDTLKAQLILGLLFGYIIKIMIKICNRQFKFNYDFFFQFIVYEASHISNRTSYSMSREFYIKTQALYEEFQKREHNFLNAENKLRSNFISKREINIPLEEYLQKINVREKESEKTYRNIMKNMEEISSRSDEISLKLEKVKVFQNSATSLTFLDCPSTMESNLQSFMSFKPNIPKFQSLEHNVKSVFDTNLRSTSTQTENVICCEKCQSTIHFQLSHNENKTPSFLNMQSDIITEPPTIYSKSEDSSTLNNAHNNSQLVSTSGNEENFISADINNYFKGDNSKMPTIPSSRESPVKSAQSDITLIKKHNSVENQPESNEFLTENVQKKITRNEKKVTELQLSENENYEPKSQDVESNVDPFTSKSDAESMNNEFDFLESDTKIVHSKTKAQNIAKSHKSLSNNAGASIDKTVSSVIDHPSYAQLKRKDNDTLHSTKKLEFSDKSETSGSVSAPHSPNISIASDSDSVYGKESSLKASAAYQALLGNAVIPKETKVNNSDSESGDEVENALANVVQKSHIKSKSSKISRTADTKRNSTSEAVDSKPAFKGSKPLSSNKTQSKLTKNTRKVLGIDTSSGSEVEFVGKTPEKKIDDDDEFDFFD